MAHMRITIDGKTAMDGDLGQWTSEPPFISEQRLAVATKTDQPWAIPLLGLIAKAGTGLTGKRMVISVTTNPNGWVLEVNQGSATVGNHD